jgi:hypothetical protein
MEIYVRLCKEDPRQIAFSNGDVFPKVGTGLGEKGISLFHQDISLGPSTSWTIGLSSLHPELVIQSG